MSQQTVTKESALVASLREQIGSLPVKLFTELLLVKLDKYKEQLVYSDDPTLRGKAQECKDLLKLISHDFA